MVCTLAVLIALIAGICIGALVMDNIHLHTENAALKAAQAKHLPYMTAEEIEDATAAILTAKFKHDFNGELLDNALAHLQKARNGNAK
jgi:hypothetical protein